jgi:hypothetical protein
MHEAVTAQVDTTHEEDERDDNGLDEAQRCLDCGEVRFVCRCWPGEG